MSPCLDTSVFYQLREGNINRVFIYYSLRGNILYLWVWDSTHHLLLMVCAIFISDGRVEVDRYIRASSVVMQAWVLFLDLLVNLRSYHNQWSRALSGDYGYKWLWLKWAPSIGSPGFPLCSRVKSSGCSFATCVRISQCRWFWDLFIMPLGSLLLEVFQAQLRPRWGDFISHLVWEYPKTP